MRRTRRVNPCTDAPPVAEFINGYFADITMANSELRHALTVWFNQRVAGRALDACLDLVEGMRSPCTLATLVNISGGDVRVRPSNDRSTQLQDIGACLEAMPALGASTEGITPEDVLIGDKVQLLALAWRLVQVAAELDPSEKPEQWAEGVVAGETDMLADHVVLSAVPGTGQLQIRGKGSVSDVLLFDAEAAGRYYPGPAHIKPKARHSSRVKMMQLVEAQQDSGMPIVVADLGCFEGQLLLTQVTAASLPACLPHSLTQWACQPLMDALAQVLPALPDTATRHIVVVLPTSKTSPCYRAPSHAVYGLNCALETLLTTAPLPGQCIVFIERGYFYQAGLANVLTLLPSTTPAEGLVQYHPRSLRETATVYTGLFNALWQTRAFVHWYVRDGMEAQQMTKSNTSVFQAWRTPTWTASGLDDSTDFQLGQPHTMAQGHMARGSQLPKQGYAPLDVACIWY